MPNRDPVVIVTGASRGIGAAVARLAGARGYAVTVNFVRDERAAHDVAACAAVLGVAVPLGVLFGLLAGYFTGIVETAVMGFTNVMLAMPPLVMALAMWAIYYVPLPPGAPTFVKPLLYVIVIIVAIIVILERSGLLHASRGDHHGARSTDWLGPVRYRRFLQ